MAEDHIALNRASWDDDAPNWVEPGRRSWQSAEPFWGIWHVPESKVGLLPDVLGLDVVELGCGTGYVSAWLKHRGASPVGIDNSSRQLATAATLQREFGLAFPLIHGDAERTPFRNERFDLAISEYGAATWCDPHAWIPEAARILRPGGLLVFLGLSNLVMLCTPGDPDALVGPTLLREQFGMCRIEWPTEGKVESSVPHGEMIRILRGAGFEIEELIEIRAPRDVPAPYPWIDAAWASRWPSEEVWKARKIA
jgi:SAM-dependent methyltransferase